MEVKMENYLKRIEDALKRDNYVINHNSGGYRCKPKSVVAVGRLRMMFDHNVIVIIREGDLYKVGYVEYCHSKDSMKLYLEILMDSVTSTDAKNTFELTNDRYKEHHKDTLADYVSRSDKHQGSVSLRIHTWL